MEYESVYEDALSAVRERRTDLVIYTDGLAMGGVTNGGAAAIVTRGDPAAPEVIHTLKRRRLVVVHALIIFKRNMQQ